jgi:predicted PurR-regulated permease PerM
LTVGKGAASIIIELFTLFVLVLLLLLEGPKMWNWTTRSSISSVLC